MPIVGIITTSDKFMQKYSTPNLPDYVIQADGVGFSFYFSAIDMRLLMESD
ncbi:MAG: hypothetical protein IIB95_13515 [Candidatus Marinimicrobia bacterium]|nr:hypothetical protein [Candidatus Neomarinimicrobiota bacterium]